VSELSNVEPPSDDAVTKSYVDFAMNGRKMQQAFRDLGKVFATMPRTPPGHGLQAMQPYIIQEEP